MIKPSLYTSSDCHFLVIAHRGASFYAPENTMAAFRKAYHMGADMIELDVLLTRDQVPVVIHDNDLKRLAGIKASVSNLTLKEVKTLDVGSWFSKKFRGEKVPALEEVLKWAKGKISLNIEIKTESVSEEVHRGVEARVIDLVRKYEMDSYVLLSSFDLRAVKRFKTLAPHISTGYLYSKETSLKNQPVKVMEELKSDFYHIDKWKLRKKNLKKLQGQAYPVLVYTVNRSRKMKNLIRQGVYGIFSDRPDRLKEVADAEIKGRDR